MNNSTDLNFQFPITPTIQQNAVVSTTTTPTPTPTSAFTAAASSTACFITDNKTQKNPRKKRSKLIRLDNPVAPNRISRPKYAKKPDPSAPKITTPCSECGKKFWSWKALFGHMRCHPERQWRGIDPPPNLRRPPSPNGPSSELGLGMSEEDHEAASSLIMLASGSVNGTSNEVTNQSVISTSGFQGALEVLDGGNGRFECSSCKKVFGSHQALGGHRASHKNVKGCFAITRSCDGEVDQDHHDNGDGGEDGDDMMMEENNKTVLVLGSGHRCSVCWRVFSSGQALGGHMRCHWDKGDEPSASMVMMTQLGLTQQQQPSGASKEADRSGGGGLDLNLPAASHVEDDQSSSYTSSGLTLDLRLGL